MSTDFKSVPLIDISGLYSTDLADRKKVAADISYAARNVGFFYVKGHEVSQKAIEGLKEAAEYFFSKPMDYKMKYYIGRSKSHRGYVPEGEENLGSSRRDRKEAISLGRELPDDHPLVQSHLPLHGGNLWPPDMPDFKEKVLNYYDQIYALSKTLIRGFALALGEEEESFDEYFNEQMAMLRMTHYPYDPPTEEGDDAGLQGIGEHTDYECFTILLAETPGLEAVNSKNEWVQVPPIPGAFVVNIGDTMEILTNRKFVATAHRVLRVNQERYSFPLFVGCNYTTRVEPLRQFLDSTVDPRYTGIQSGDHIWASIMQTYKYLKDKLESGELRLPDSTIEMGTFGPPVFAESKPKLAA